MENKQIHKLKHQVLKVFEECEEDISLTELKGKIEQLFRNEAIENHQYEISLGHEEVTFLLVFLPQDHPLTYRLRQRIGI